MSLRVNHIYIYKIYVYPKLKFRLKVSYAVVVVLLYKESSYYLEIYLFEVRPRKNKFC